MKRIFNLQHQHLVELYSKGYTLDLMFYLELLEGGVDVYLLDEYRAKGIILTMERKGLIADGFITKKGLELLEYVRSKPANTKIAKTKHEDLFEQWWAVYPASNMFEHKGKVFSGIQSKKIKKPECKALFNKYIESGEFTAKDIIGATKYHFEVARDLSYKSGKNEISYISNSERYLREKSFSPYLKLYSSGKGTGVEDENSVKKIIKTKDLF